MTPASTVAYDANGNTLSDPSGKSYSWDFENRLTQAVVPGANGGTTTFKYDPFGRRIQKSGPLGTTNYLYDGPNAVEEVDSSGNAIARYVDSSEVDDQLSELRSSKVSYYEQDGIGPISSLTNSASAVAGTYVYDAFGNLTGSTGSITNPFRYTGREFDAETGVYFYRARYYDSTVGRYIGEDPLGFPGSGPNFYGYVKNDPITLTDPFGLCSKQPKCKKCLPKVLAAVNSKIGVPVTYVGTTKFKPDDPATTDPNDPGMRNGACNFDFFVPGYSPSMPLGNCGRYSPNFTGIGPSLHIVEPQGPCNPLNDPTTWSTNPSGFSFTAHIDSGYVSVWTPLGAATHGIVDVLLKIRHGC
ncbi:MAG: RHS repeat-associated core domain-containing protein [Candidatus Sulfotelmatobacter sp.]